MQLTHHLPFQPAVGRPLNLAARLARRIAGLGDLSGFGDEVPPEPHLWAEMAPDLALRRISRQAEAHYAAATKGRP
ncbi:hypothetical protein AB0K00_53050 [Dactylosporangium sp. NPDC049525]|uniref:hypothetical protein n=1 Tax=Dactylosporangium sp. NPDC049525 TaxID=3154730 RepID=UPI0034363A72